MVRRVFSFGTSLVGLALAAVLVMGLAAPASALAFGRHRPSRPAAQYLVTSTSYTPVAGTAVTVTAQLANASHGLVRRGGVKVTWSKTGMDGSFSSATSLTNKRGFARVEFTTGTTAGTSYTVTATDSGHRAGTSPTITTIAGPATQMALKDGDGQSASAGTAVGTPPSVLVTDTNNNPVSGVSVTFAVATGGGSVTDADSTTDAAGIAAVGSWTLGATAGANTLTASSDSLTGSPVTFTASGSAGVLQVQYNGQPVRAYSLAELQALTPFAGWAGFRKSTGTVVGPDAVTGVKVTDIVADALGSPLTAAESVAVAAVPPNSPYSKTFSYDRLVNFTGFAMYDATSNTSVDIASLTGPLAAVLLYSDPAGVVMSPASALRFIIADATSENVVMNPGSDSVSQVNQLNVIDPGP